MMWEHSTEHVVTWKSYLESLSELWQSEWAETKEAKGLVIDFIP